MVARNALEAARADVHRSDRSVELAETGNDQIRVVELLVEVKKETVEEARRSLESAEHDLAYTKIRTRSPAWWSGGTATSATSPRQVSRC